MRRTHRRLSAAVLAVAALLVAGCLRSPAPPTDPELAAELGLPESTPIHRVHLAGTGAATRVLPSELRLESGHWLQMVVEDHRVYAVRFLLDDMEPPQAAFLRGSEQESSPPLARPGSRFVISFDDAPAGRYPFVVEGYGEAVHGVLHVRDGD